MIRARGIAVFATAAAVGIAGSVASANILTNPSFELPALVGGDSPGSPGWGDYGGGTFTLAANIGVPAHDGVQVFKTFGFSGIFQDAAVNAGDTVDASAWALNWSNDAVSPTNTAVYAQLLVIFLAPDHSTQIGSTLVASFMQPVLAVDVWTQRSINAAAPAGAGFVRFQLNTGNPQGGAVMYDDASLVITPVPAPAAAGLFAGVGLLGLRRRR